MARGGLLGSLGGPGEGSGEDPGVSWGALVGFWGGLRKYRKRVAFRLKTAELGQKSILPYVNSDLKFWLKKEATQWKEVD